MGVGPGIDHAVCDSDGQAEDEVRQDYDDVNYDVCRPVVRAGSRWKTT